MDWYQHSGYPAQSANGDSASARSEFDAIALNGTKMPALTGSALRIVRVNAAGTALESVTTATATLETYADAQAGTHHKLTGVAGTNTITALATPTLTAYVTDQTFQAESAGANTGAATINIDGLGARSLLRPDGSALQASDIPAAGYPLNIQITAAAAILLNPYNGVSAPITAAASKGTPVGADVLGGVDSATGLLAKFSFTNIVAYLSGLCSAGWNAATATLATNATNATGSAVVTGLVQSGTNPKARAYVGGTGQNLTSGVPVQVNFSTNLYAIGITTTGGTFTPSVAGYYSVSWNLSVDSNAAITAFGVTPYFSLTSEAYGSQSFTGNFAYASGSIERYFNGTTDNFYVKVSATGTGTLSITNGLTCGMFMHLIP